MAGASNNGCARRLAPALAAALALGGCAPQLTEIFRTPNPGKTLDAVAVIRETDATVGFVTEVHIKPRGLKAKGNAVFRADYVDGLTLTWDGPLTLHIGARRARPFLQEHSKQTETGEVKIIYDLKPFVRPNSSDE